MKLKILAVLFVIFILSSCSKEEKIIGLKQNIHHDDFEYSIQNVEHAASIGSVKANGIYYIITFRVENDAKRGWARLG